MASKTDRRVRRTKALLIRALLLLLKQKGLKDISVKELCEAADINRGTFYLHYRDIYDMMDQIQNELTDEFEVLLAKHTPDELNGDPYALIYDIFHFTAENSELFHALLSPNGDISFLAKMKSLFRENYLNVWFSALHNKDLMRFEYSYSFIAAGCVGLIESWLFSEHQETPEEIAALACSIITTGIQSLI